MGKKDPFDKLAITLRDTFTNIRHSKVFHTYLNSAYTYEVPMKYLFSTPDHPVTLSAHPNLRLSYFDSVLMAAY
jgi:hypothetical protein